MAAKKTTKKAKKAKPLVEGAKPRKPAAALVPKKAAEKLRDAVVAGSNANVESQTRASKRKSKKVPVGPTLEERVKRLEAVVGDIAKAGNINRERMVRYLSGEWK